MAEINEGDLISKGAIKEVKDAGKAFADLDAQLKQVIATAKGIEGAIKKGDSIKGVSKELTDLERQEKQLKTITEQVANATAKQNEAYRTQAAELAKLNANTRAAVKEKNSLNDAYTKESQKLSQLAKDYRNVALQQGVNSKEAKNLLEKHKALAGQLNGLNRDLGKFNDNVGNYPKRVGAAVGQLVGFATATAAAVLGIRALIGVFKEAFQTFKKYEDANATLRAVLGATKDATKELEIQQRRLAGAFSATDIARAQTELARLGKSTGDILELTPAILNAATAFEVDLAKAAELVAGQLNAFGLAAKDGGKVVDILAKSINLSSLSFERLMMSLPKVGGAAKALDVSLEKTVATLGVIVDQNIEAEKAGTSFRNILIESAKTGVHYTENLKRIAAAKNQITEADKLFGVQDAVVARAMAVNLELIEKNTKSLEDAMFTAQAIAATLKDTVTGDLKEAASAWENFVLSVITSDGKISQSIRFIIRSFTGLMETLTLFNTSSKELADAQWSDLLQVAVKQNRAEIERLTESFGDLGEKMATEKSYDIVEGKLKKALEYAEGTLKAQMDYYNSSLTLVDLESDLAAISQHKAEAQERYNEATSGAFQRPDDARRSKEVIDSLQAQELALRKVIQIRKELTALNDDELFALKQFREIQQAVDEALQKALKERADGHMDNVNAITREYSEMEKLLFLYTKVYNQVFDINEINKQGAKQQEDIIKSYSRLISAKLTELETDKANEAERIRIRDLNRDLDFRDYLDKVKLEKQYAEESRQISQVSFEEKLDASIQYFDQIVQLSGEINNIFAGFTARRLQEIDLEEDRNKRKLENDLFLAGDNALKKEAIQKQFDAQQEVLNQKRIQEQQKAARFEKALAIAQSAINTALAATKAAAQTGVGAVLAVPLVLALGAAQIAAIASQPIPAYAEGTENHKGGLALVGDGGGVELITEPNKAPYLSDSKPEIRNLAKGTKVLSHEDTIRQLALGGLSRGSMDSRQAEKQTEAIKSGFRSLEKTIKNKKEHQIIGEITGYNRRGSRVKYIDSLRNK